MSTRTLLIILFACTLPLAWGGCAGSLSIDDDDDAADDDGADDDVSDDDTADDDASDDDVSDDDVSDDDVSDDDVSDDDVSDDDVSDDDVSDDDMGDDDSEPVDNDGDGWPADDDCNDNNPDVNPGMPEIPCDGLNNDCSGQTPDNPDADGDGVHACDGDCDDNDPAVHPGAPEVCDGIDQNCNGIPDDKDADGDGFADQDCGFDDCDDSDPTINPAAPEAPGDGVDSNCDGDDDPGPGEWCLHDPNVIGVPGTVQFTISQQDWDDGPAGPGHYYDDIEFEGLAGWEIHITMVDNANDFDPYLYLLDDTCAVIAEDDDGLGGDDPLIELTLPADGTYTIVATTANPNEFSQYEVEIWEGAAPPGENCELDSWVGTCGEVNNNFGLNQNDADTGPYGPGRYYDDVEFEGLAGQQVTVYMSSNEFDTYALLLGPACDIVAENDDGAPNDTNSVIDYTLPADGIYTMVFTSKYSFSDPEPTTGAFVWELQCQ